MNDSAPRSFAPPTQASLAFRQAAALLIVLFAWLAFTAPSGGFEPDLQFWIRWSHRIDRFGLGKAYGGVTGQANYLPVFLWVLAGLGRVTGGALTAENVQLVKVATLLFDLGLGLALAWFLASRGRNPALALLVVANPATLYDSWVWGQIDAIHTAFVAGSWLALAAGAGPLAAALFLLALNSKLQTLVFLPFFAFALAHVLGRRVRAWAASLVACAAVQAVLLAPFLNAQALRALRQNVLGIVGYFKAVSLNAYNLWYLLLGDPSEVEDTGPFLHATYRLWGVLLLALALALIAVPFLRLVRRAWREGEPRRLADDGFLLLALAGLAFFLFPTEVHERFLHPAVVLLGIDAVQRGRYLAYAVLSGAYLLNLENVLRWRGLRYESLLFDPRLVALAILAVFAAATWQAFRRTRATGAVRPA